MYSNALCVYIFKRSKMKMKIKIRYFKVLLIEQKKNQHYKNLSFITFKEAQNP